MQTSTSIDSTNSTANVQVNRTTEGSVVVSWDQQIGKAIWTTVEVTVDGFATWGLSVRKAVVR